MRRIFLSYAREDILLAQEIFLHFRDDGPVEPWLDVALLRPAQDWRPQLADAIAKADVVVCLASFYSLQSPQVMDERQFAAAVGTPVQYWLLDDAAAKYLRRGEDVRDLRSDPVSRLKWDWAITDSEKHDWERPTRPQYVQRYLRFWSRTLLTAGPLAVLSIGLIAWLNVSNPGPHDEPFHLYLGAVAIAWLIETCWHLNQVRRRRAPWREVAFYWRLAVGLFLTYGAPTLALFVLLFRYSAATALVVAGASFLVASAVLLLKPSINLALLRKPFGQNRFTTRSNVSRRELVRPSVTKRKYREPAVLSEMAVWSPAFSRRHSLRRPAQMQSSLELDRNASPRPVPSLVGVIAVDADRNLAEALRSRVGMIQAVCSVEDEVLLQPRAPGETFVFILTQRSRPSFDEVFTRLGASGLALVAVGIKEFPPQVREAQIIDLTQLDLDAGATKLQAITSGDSKFEGFKDLRSVIARAPSDVTFLLGWYLVILALDWFTVGIGNSPLQAAAAAVSVTMLLSIRGFLRRQLTRFWLAGLTIVITLLALSWLFSTGSTDVVRWLFPPTSAAWIVLQTYSSSEKYGSLALWFPTNSRQAWCVILPTAAILIFLLLILLN